MYLDYDTYKANGGKLSEADFRIYEQLSEAELNNMTGCALPESETRTTCMMLLIDAYEKTDSVTLESRTQSMSNDGVSVSYRADNSAECALKIARDRIRLLLANAGLSTKSMVVKYRA